MNGTQRNFLDDSSGELIIVQDNAADPRKTCDKRVVIAVIAIAIIAVIGTIVALYFLNIDVKTFIDHIFTQIKEGSMPVWHGIVMVGVPIVGGGALIGFSLFVLKKHRERIEGRDALIESVMDEKGDPVDKDSFGPSFGSEILATLETLKPTTEQAKIVAAVVLALIALGLIAWGISTNPTVNQWIHQQAIPTIQEGMNHSMKIWEALAYIGGSAVVVTIVANVALHILHKRALEKLAEGDLLGNDDVSGKWGEVPEDSDECIR